MVKKWFSSCRGLLGMISLFFLPCGRATLDDLDLGDHALQNLRAWEKTLAQWDATGLERPGGELPQLFPGFLLQDMKGEFEASNNHIEDTRNKLWLKRAASKRKRLRPVDLNHDQNTPKRRNLDDLRVARSPSHTTDLQRDGDRTTTTLVPSGGPAPRRIKGSESSPSNYGEEGNSAVEVQAQHTELDFGDLTSDDLANIYSIIRKRATEEDSRRESQFSGDTSTEAALASNRQIFQHEHISATEAQYQYRIPGRVTQRDTSDHDFLSHQWPQEELSKIPAGEIVQKPQNSLDPRTLNKNLVTAVILNDVARARTLLEYSVRLQSQAPIEDLVPLALRAPDRAMMKLLLRFGADPNRRLPNSGGALLHDAVKTGDDEYARILLEKGADIRIQDFSKMTPLFLARQLGEGIIENLIKNRLGW